ncbi:hypothetical protein QBC35DRAFT_193910 [Podospora australis]|uniref:Uncharacterized protein n=1 Tax=Podospora australis TaxID=1536484 RepID=A0AAN7AD54_9PEZI|nr:hypothetical protein QBC35DRAFT_193910 [Podospora australis]
MGCLSALKFWRKKPAPVRQEAIPAEKIVPYSPQASSFSDTEKQSHQEVTRSSPAGPSTRGVPIRPDVNPAYSAYSTPADPSWTNSLTRTQVSTPLVDEAKLKEEGVDDAEIARRRKAEEARRKAEQEEQERLDFLQMM